VNYLKQNIILLLHIDKFPQRFLRMKKDNEKELVRVNYCRESNYSFVSIKSYFIKSKERFFTY